MENEGRFLFVSIDWSHQGPGALAAELYMIMNDAERTFDQLIHRSSTDRSSIDHQQIDRQ